VLSHLSSREAAFKSIGSNDDVHNRNGNEFLKNEKFTAYSYSSK
jgi:hypothetical protein